MDKTAIDQHFKGDYTPFYSKFLTGTKAIGRGEFSAVCPFHEDTEPSLNFNGKTGQYFCHGCQAKGNIFHFYAKIHGLDIVSDFPAVVEGIARDFSLSPEKPRERKIAQIYSYTDSAGKLLFQVCRFDPKTFRQRRPDGNGGYVWNLKGVQPVLYRLPEVIEADEVLIVEGEKDTDNLAKLGFTATTAPMGAGKWKDEYSSCLKGKNVVLIPDNDPEGKKHMQMAVQSLKGVAASIRILDLPDMPLKGDVSDFISKCGDGVEVTERLSKLIEGAPEYEQTNDKLYSFMNVRTWLESEPERPQQIFKNLFDAGDKVALIGGSKYKKTFLLDQMLLCLASGKPFLGWETDRPGNVVLIQFEIQPYHKHRRMKYLTRGLGIKPDDLGDRFNVLNARGLGLTGVDGLEKLTPDIMRYEPEVIVIDPLYKIATGVENNAEDAKIVLNSFDVIAEKTKAAIIFAHHDPKGSPGDRDIRDRGAGSNVLSRDYDACFTMTSHVSEENVYVLETLLRNYRPQDPLVIEWTESENGGLCFITRTDLAPEKKTSRSPITKAVISTYYPVAESILETEEVELATFKAAFKNKTSLSDNRIREFITWATAGGAPHLETREERGPGKHKKWVRISQ